MRERWSGLSGVMVGATISVMMLLMVMFATTVMPTMIMMVVPKH